MHALYELADLGGDISINAVQGHAKRLRTKYLRLSTYWRKRRQYGRANGYAAAARHLTQWFDLGG